MEEDEEKKPKPFQQLCFDCLDLRLKSDFSNQLLFSYGVSDSPLPSSSSSAVVQMSNSGGETCSASQFVLVYLPSDEHEHEHEHDCFIEYVNEYGLETNRGSNNQDPAKIGVGIVDEQPASLDSLSNGGRKTPLDGIGFKDSTCNCAGRFSCLRTMTALYLIACIGICSYSISEEIASDFLSGGLEDHILCSLSLLIERKASRRGQHSVNFLCLLGIPSFDENSIPGCLRHPTIAPVLGLLKTSGYINLMLPKTPYNLENILHFSPNALKSEWHIRFLMYQMLSVALC